VEEEEEEEEQQQQRADGEVSETEEEREGPRDGERGRSSGGGQRRVWRLVPGALTTPPRTPEPEEEELLHAQLSEHQPQSCYTNTKTQSQHAEEHGGGGGWGGGGGGALGAGLGGVTGSATKVVFQGSKEEVSLVSREGGGVSRLTEEERERIARSREAALFRRQLRCLPSFADS
jgi:hypothetical protein